MDNKLIKKCTQCNVEFNYVPNKLNEQKYCSKVCRTKANNIRRIQLIRDEYEKPKETINQNKLNEVPLNFNNNSNQINGYQSQSINSNDNNPYSIKDIIETKIENVKLQLMQENLIAKLSEANGKITEYENEDNEEDEEIPKNDMNLSNIIEKAPAIISGVFLLWDGYTERFGKKTTA